MLFLSLLLAAPPAPLSALAYRPDGQQLAVGGYGTVAIVTANGAVARHHTVVGPVTALAWSADGQRLAVACGMPGQAGRVRVFTNDASMSDFTPHKDSIYGLTFTADGQLATGSYDRLVKLSDPATGRELKSLNDHSDSVYAVAAQADGKLLASVAADRAVKLWIRKPANAYTPSAMPPIGCTPSPSGLMAAKWLPPEPTRAFAYGRSGRPKENCRASHSRMTPP